MRTPTSLILGSVFASGALFAQSDAYFEKEAMTGRPKEFSPYANRGYPTRVFFGDTHLHTALSMDAGTFGNRLGLEEAYRFTRGEQVTSSGGFQAKLGRPLDFVVIADHSDGMGFFQMFAKGNPAVMDQDEGRRWHQAINEEKTGGQLLAIPHNGNLANGLMFDVETLSGEKLTRDYAERRQRWEPLYETTQIKGDG